MKNEEVAEKIIDSLCNRYVFDDWWHNMDESFKIEIKAELLAIVYEGGEMPTYTVNYEEDGRCPNCNDIIFADDNYCSNCGIKLDWTNIFKINKNDNGKK